MIKVVVFDFDGVLVDSNPLKDKAWFKIFDNHPRIPRHIVADVLSQNKGTRFDILHTIFQRAGFSKEEIQKHIQTEALRFDALVQDWIVKRGLIRGVANTLADFSKRFRIYINSGTPHASLKMSVKRLGIRHSFQDIYGSPPKKEENLKTILDRENISGKEAVVIGDAEEDYRSAYSQGAFFIAVASGFYDWGLQRDFPIISSIDLSRLLFLFQNHQRHL